MYLLVDTMTCRFKIPIHFMKVGCQGRQPTTCGRRGDLGGRGYNKPQEDVPRHEGWRKDNFEDYGENPNVGQVYCGGYYGGQQKDKTLDKTKQKVPSFKGESDPNVFLDWERQMEKLFIVRNYSDIVKVKLVVVGKFWVMHFIGGKRLSLKGREMKGNWLKLGARLKIPSRKDLCRSIIIGSFTTSWWFLGKVANCWGV